MSTVNKIKFNLYKWSAIIAALAMLGVVGYFLFRTLPEAKKTLGVSSLDYPEETEAAMDVWNGYVGCKFLVQGDEVLVKSDDGAPCNDPFRPEDEWGHGGTAYKCGSRFEIMVSHPGNTNTTAHIIGHELGHVLGRPHGPGIMGKAPDPNGENTMLRISDADTAAIKKEFCK